MAVVNMFCSGDTDNVGQQSFFSLPRNLRGRTRQRKSRQRFLTTFCFQNMELRRPTTWIFILSLLIRFITSVPIDNGVESQPEVSCNQDTAKISVLTRKPFYGHVYVKGQFRVQECHLDLTDGPTDQRPGEFAEKPKALLNEQNVNFYVSYRDCYVKRERSVNPLGLSYTATVVVQFHHLFSTKVDRAYSITCFYMETQKTLTFSLDVSMLSTIQLYETRPLPVCIYEVLRTSLNGSPVKFAQVGEQVFHKWTCSGGEGIYSMLVHSCVASDGGGSEYKLIDQYGCSIDPIAVGDLAYTEDVSMAYVEVHVFKFADRMQVSFQCQVSLCVKLDNGCSGITPPVCVTKPYARKTETILPPSSAPPLDEAVQPSKFIEMRTKIDTFESTISHKLPYHHTTSSPLLQAPFKIKSRIARDLDESFPSLSIKDTLDLTTDDILIFNADDKIPNELLSARNASLFIGFSNNEKENVAAANLICLSPFGMTQIAFGIIFVFFVLSATLVFCQRRYYHRLTNRRTGNNSHVSNLS